jgi:hypothetical protein
MTALVSTQLVLTAETKALATESATNVAVGDAAASAATGLVVNVARNKAVTTNAATTSNQPLSALTDGVTARDKYVLYSVSTGPKWAQVDLGRAYDITRLNVRSDWGSSAGVYRTTRDVVVQLSNDPDFATGVVTVFNNDADNSSGLGAGTDAEYLEPADGSGKDIHLASTVNARYVRFWANGHVRVNGQLNLVNTPIEIEAYADPEDAEAPGTVADLTVAGATTNAAELAWTAPGNDGNVGTAIQYDIRYATSPITEATWASATQASNEPAPAAAGTAQKLLIEGLVPGKTYYFAMRTRDFAYESALSNVASVATPAVDTVAPAAIADLGVEAAMFRSAKLTWTAPGNDGLLGSAAKYEVRYATSPITEATWDSALQAEDELPQRPVGSAMQYKVTELTPGETYYFAVRTLDAAGNVSGLSNAASATIATPTPDAVTVSSLSALQQAINEAPANGRVITLAAGTYDQTAPIQISGKNNITIQGATSDYNDTVIKGQGINSTVVDMNFRVNNSDYVTFKHLTIQDSYYHAIQLNEGSNYLVADSIKTWDNGEGGFKTTFNLSSGNGYSDYGIVKNSLIGYTTTGMRDHVEGIDLIASKGWIIQGNRFENSKRPSGTPGYGFFAKANSIDTIVENNVFLNSDIAISFGGGGSGATFFRNQDQTYEHRGGIMRNNVVIGTEDAAIYMNKATGYKVYNNTMLGISPDTTSGSVESRYPQSDGDVRNNLMDKPVKERDGGTITASHNIENATLAWLLDPANGDYRLNPATAQAAIDAGIALPDVPTDFAGNPRPLGAAYDIGVYETLAGAPSIAVDTVDWTNGDVVATIDYPAGAAQKQYRIGEAGEWTTYVGPIALAANGTVYARGLDAAGRPTDVASYEVTNIDKTAPQLSVQLDKTSLWPANGKLALVNATWSANDGEGSGIVSVVLDSIVSSEANTDPDDIAAVLGAPTASFALRAEREGNGLGRVYTVTYKATDAAGNETRVSVDVVVPHDQSGN